MQKYTKYNKHWRTLKKEPEENSINLDIFEESKSLRKEAMRVPKRNRRQFTIQDAWIRLEHLYPLIFD